MLSGKQKPTSQQVAAADEVIEMVKSYLEACENIIERNMTIEPPMTIALCLGFGSRFLLPNSVAVAYGIFVVRYSERERFSGQ